MDGVDNFRFIGIFEGLEHHGIPSSNLKFIGLDHDEFKSIKTLQRDEFELKIKQFQMMSDAEKQEATRCDQSRNVNLDPVADMMDHNDLLAVNPLESTDVLQKLDSIRNFSFPIYKDPITENLHDTQTVFQFPTEESTHAPSSDPIQHPSSIFQEVESEKSYAFILSDPIDQNATFESSLTNHNSMYEKIRPLSSASSDIYSSLERKKTKHAPLHSDFRPISSELHILTSDSCFDF